MVRFWNVAWVLCASVSAAVVQGGDLWDGYEPNTGPSLKALEKGKLGMRSIRRPKPSAHDNS